MVGPELFLGLVGAVGTDLQYVDELVAKELRGVGYTDKRVRLSELLLDCYVNRELRGDVNGPEDTRIDNLMQAGDRLRVAAARGDAVALLAISKIRQIREEAGSSGKSLSRHAFLLRSLKHPDEIKTLRDVYGGAFIVISVYTPRSVRKEALCKRISRSRHEYDDEKFSEVADRLIDTDEKEPGNSLGQNVQDAFPEADIFLDASDPTDLPRQVTRMIEIIFRHPYRTPTLDEYGLFHAKASALRSADLSRQVGAVIMTCDGEVIAAGCNEVPKSGGGAVWEGDEDNSSRDRRDFKVGHDSSVRMKHDIFEEIFERLRCAGWLSENASSLPNSTLVDDALFSDSPIFSGTRAASIIEFGRIVHAEMMAITDAARRGLSVKDATLYCTTFPCHVCARHIIASGIRRVVYIEPYPKSMAKTLYKGSIDVDHDTEADDDAVEFESFVGVSPNRYIDFFEMPVRKDKRGHIVSWMPAEALPRLKQYPTYLEIETVHVDQLAQHSTSWGITEAENEEGESQ